MSEASKTRRWLQDFKVYAEPPVARMVLLGFSAGLPLLLVLGTLSYRLREAGIDRTTIGFLSWVALAYGFKWVWAPLVDRLPLPLITRALGRRRSWLLLAQVGLIVSIAGMALVDPQHGLRPLVLFALAAAFCSATQDIALDAFRIESATVDRQAAMAAAYQIGYRGAMICAGAGALQIAALTDPDELTYQHAPWMVAYLVMAGLMLVGFVTVLFSPEPRVTIPAESLERERQVAERARLGGMSVGLARLVGWFYGAVVSPFLDFVMRYRWHAVLMLALIATYRVSDIVLGVMSNPFYRDMGYTKSEVAWVSGVYGVALTLVGSTLGGVFALRLGVMRVLFLGALLSAATNLLFAWLSTRGHDLPGLIAVISADNLSAGIASAAFVAYLSSLTSVAYSATQYALFSSVMLLLPKFIAGWSGLTVDTFGYELFFTATALLGAPVLLLTWLVGQQARRAAPQPAAPASNR